ncbi:hypothetical protein DRE_00156 [Drechslerella stenobrocha 248]|uniref:CCHC-type domain-containing protein n=1 Tax=Drechslerella stenobrocha 248 TaxID=1043628 RepID=W7HXB7_9PEZI|nr:hypothetical protein DRE_00156 [Drechslerella stenobrocha 248]
MENLGASATVESGAASSEPLESSSPPCQETGKVEIMDLTGDGEPVVVLDAAPVLPQLEGHKDSPPGTQEMNKFVQPSVQALDAENVVAAPAPAASEAVIGSSDDDDSDSDSDLMDDSGITLNLQEEADNAQGDDEVGDDNDEKPNYIVIESSDEEEPEKGRAKRTPAPELASGGQPGAPEAVKSNGAIAVHTGLKLGKAGRSALGVAVVTRRPLTGPVDTSRVQVVDYSNPGGNTPPSASAHVLKGLSPRRPSVQSAVPEGAEVIDLSSDSAATPNGDREAKNENADVSLEATTAYRNDNRRSDIENAVPDGDEAEDQDEGEASDNASVSSVDTDIWAHQQIYYVRQPELPLLHEEARPLFGGDASGRDAVRNTLAAARPQPLPKKRKICDVCLAPHLTELCDKLKCDVCKSSREHFSFNCPYKTSAHKDLSNLPICNVPPGRKDFEIWRILPPTAKPPAQKSAKIPVSCYECGDDDHFGDDCPSLGNHRANISSESIWNAKAAAEWTTMNMDSKYIKKTGKRSVKANEAEDGEPSWFDARMSAAKEAFPDSELKSSQVEEARFSQPQGHAGNKRPNIQMNLPRNIPGQGYNDGGSGGGGAQSFTRFQSQGGSLAARVGPKHDGYNRNDHSGRRDRSRSPRRHSFDRRGGFEGPQSYRDRSQDFPRGNDPQPPYRGRQNYHEAPPPPQFQQSQQQGQSGYGGWSLPGSIQRTLHDSVNVVNGSLLTHATKSYLDAYISIETDV